MKEVWVYFETDGDSGWYHVTVFGSEKGANDHKKARKSAYGNVRKLKLYD